MKQTVDVAALLDGYPCAESRGSQEKTARITCHVLLQEGPGVFQRDGIVGLGLVVAGLFVAGNLLADSGR
jgi:hypothetical protein